MEKEHKERQTDDPVFNAGYNLELGSDTIKNLEIMWETGIVHGKIPFEKAMHLLRLKRAENLKNSIAIESQLIEQLKQ